MAATSASLLTSQASPLASKPAESTIEEWERVIGINLRGVWACMKHELRHNAPEELTLGIGQECRLTYPTIKFRRISGSSGQIRHLNKGINGEGPIDFQTVS